jgi:peptidoglycan/LPS O-acetylase OafA/YrhL/glycosyltransferase involved in cell wall biosynthesis
MKAETRFAANNFTVLRLLLALMVVLGHYQIFIGVASPPWPFNYAMAAVDCFFVVSGYLVSNSFDRDSNLARFFIRRFFRIYPLYVTIVALQTVALGLLDPFGFVANAGALLRYFLVNAAFANFLQHNIGHGVLDQLIDPNLNPSLWTLKIEVGFYLVLPAIWWVVRRFGDRVLFGIFVLSAAYYGVLDHWGEYEMAKQLPGQLQFFVLGIAAYRYGNRLAMSRVTGAVLTLGLGIVFTLLLRPHPLVIYPLIVGALTTVAALRTPHIRMEADMSYGVYLLHAPIIQLSLIYGIYRPDWIGVTATVAVVLLAAAASERLIERPGIALGKRLTRLVPGSFVPPVPARAATDRESGLTVVMLNDFCYVQGGASKVAIDEAIALARSGIRVIFLGAVGPPCAELAAAPLAVECLGQRELVEAGRHPLVAVQGLWNIRAARKMRAVLRSLPRDRTIVHLHGYTKALSMSPIRVARRLGYPVICTLHDFFAACPNGAFFDYAKGMPCPKRAMSAGCVLTQCDKRHYGHKLFRVVRELAQRCIGRFPGAVTHYIALSRRSAAILLPYLPPSAALHRLQNPTDAEPAPPVPVARNHAVLCVGRLDPEKGVSLVAETARRLGREVIFVGDGPLRAEIEKMPGLRVTGWLPRDEVRRLLADARCLVFPSLWYETYGLAVAEAAARGVPAIVSDISAAAERIEDNVTGWRFRSGDPNDLARCLRLIESDALVEAAGQAAHRRFWKSGESSPQAHTNSLVRIYRHAMQA